MSAFIVSREHIRILVEAAISADHSGDVGLSWVWDTNRESGTYKRRELRPGQWENADQAGQMLWDENVRSVQFRYPEESVEDLPGPSAYPYVYGHHILQIRRTPSIAVLKAIHGYEYQSCEHPEWEGSEAHAFCQALAKKMVRRLPGYDEANWAPSDPPPDSEPRSSTR